MSTDHTAENAAAASGENWNPNTAGPSCDWCGECEWCDDLGRVISSAEQHSSGGTGHDDLTAEEQYRSMGRAYPPESGQQ